MKKLDILLIRGFIPPFIVGFSVSMFVLLMIFLWKAVDDILGKGASLFMVLEYIFYLGLYLVPMALPIGVLLATVLVMGNFSERYELTSMKSAGVSLMRIMRPLMYMCGGLAIFSFICANYIIPVAQLKFQTRLYDLKSQKLALSLEDEVFNYDFSKFVIKIESKKKDSELENVKIYDLEQAHRGEIRILEANTGTMSNSDDGQFLIFQLNDGAQYQDLKRGNGGQQDAKYPFLRTNFSSIEKRLDLSEFELNQTDEKLFKDNFRMLNVKQLYIGADSLADVQVVRQGLFEKGTHAYFHFIKTSDSTQYHTPISIAKDRKLGEQYRSKYKIRTDRDSSSLDTRVEYPFEQVQNKRQINLPAARQKSNPSKANNSRKPDKHQDDKLLGTPDSFQEVFTDFHLRQISSKAAVAAKGIRAKAAEASSIIDSKRKLEIRHWEEISTKMSFALACFVFLFIGAPMGSIVRKGGFGYPVLVAILFFVIYFLMLDIGSKLGREDKLPHPLLGPWLPHALLIPLGIYVTRRAIADAKLMDLGLLWSNIRRLFSKAATSKSKP